MTAPGVRAANIMKAQWSSNARSATTRALAINPDRLDARLDRAFSSKTIALDPANPDYYVNRAETHRYDNSLKLAAADYTHAIALDPSNAPLYTNRCAVQIMHWRFIAAFADFWRCMKLALFD